MNSNSDAASKQRARRPDGGADTNSSGAGRLMESDAMAKNRAWGGAANRPPGRSTTRLSQRGLEEQTRLQSSERDLVSKPRYNPPGLDDTIVNPSLPAEAAHSDRQPTYKDAFGETPNSKTSYDEEFLDEHGYADASMNHQPTSQEGPDHPVRDPNSSATGLVHLGDVGHGGFDAFVPEKQVVDAFDVVVLKSDEEEERVQSKKFRRVLCLSTLAVIILIGAIAIPLGIYYGRRELKVTQQLTAAPSLSPSAAPSSTRFADVLDYVRQFSVANPSPLDDPTSPQFLAADWVANDDLLQFSLESEHLTQRYLLALFYFSTGGDQWEECNRFDNCNAGFSWLDAQDECNWHGIRCNKESQVEKILSGNQAPLGNNLQGTLPMELSHLSNMQSFVLILGGIKGTIPPEYGKWSKLTAFFIQDHSLSGTIPSELIANGKGIDMLALNGNLLTGAIPTALASMPALRDLQLADNFFNGTIPTELGSLSATLRNLELDSNDLIGEIPDSIYTLSLLSQLSLNTNTLKGSISTLIGQLTILKTFEIYENQITGNFPDTIFTLPELKIIRVSGNKMAGTLSPQLTLLNNTLVQFSAANNSWTGTWPNVFDNMTSLTTIFLEGTQLTGTVSANLCNMTLVNLTVPTTVNCDVKEGCCQKI